MIAMQYGFTLPADYDMAIIRQRIAGKGHLLDDFPRLRFKAYLYAERGAGAGPDDDNAYAPFYLWQDNEGMNAFLGSAGFAALARAFGWPSVRTWSVWQAELAADLRVATRATREIVAIDDHAPLTELREAETLGAQADRAAGALAAVSAFDPTGWTLLRFRLWPEAPGSIARTGMRSYRVGHVSQPGVGADPAARPRMAGPEAGKQVPV
jgi:hypothetical protein